MAGGRGWWSGWPRPCGGGGWSWRCSRAAVGAVAGCSRRTGRRSARGVRSLLVAVAALRGGVGRARRLLWRALRRRVGAAGVGARGGRCGAGGRSAARAARAARRRGSRPASWCGCGCCAASRSLALDGARAKSWRRACGCARCGSRATPPTRRSRAVTLVRRDPLADTGAAAVAAPEAEALSLWEPIPVGVDELGEPVAIGLVERNVLLGGEPGAGKTRRAVAARRGRRRSTRARGCGCSTASWSSCRRGRRARERLVGPDVDEAIDAAARAARRDGGALPRAARPRAAQGPPRGRAAAAPGGRATSWRSTSAPRTARSAREFAELLRDLVARGRAAGVIVCAATQKPGADVVPSALRDLFGFRLALRCNTPQASDTILGQGWAIARALDAATIAPRAARRRAAAGRGRHAGPDARLPPRPTTTSTRSPSAPRRAARRRLARPTDEEAGAHERAAGCAAAPRRRRSRRTPKELLVAARPGRAVARGWPSCWCAGWPAIARAPSRASELRARGRRRRAWPDEAARAFAVEFAAAYLSIADGTSRPRATSAGARSRRRSSSTRWRRSSTGSEPRADGASSVGQVAGVDAARRAARADHRRGLARPASAPRTVRLTIPVARDAHGGLVVYDLPSLAAGAAARRRRARPRASRCSAPSATRSATC